MRTGTGGVPQSRPGRPAPTDHGTAAPPPGRPRFEFGQRPSAVPVERAAPVTVAAGLWLGCAGLLLVAAVLMLVDLDGLQAAVRAVVDRDFPRETPAVRDRAVSLTLGVLVGGAVVLGLLLVAATALLHSGRGAARAGLVVLLAAVVVLLVLAVGIVPAAARLVLVLAVACGLVGAVAMLLPSAGRWFAARR